jgi:hypothetical protein
VISEAALVAGALVVALGAAEIVHRATDRLRPPSNPPECGYWDPAICALYAPAGGYGYALRPSTRAEYDYPDTNPRRITVMSNRLGFRDRRELDEPDDRRRLLVLGDSFVFGEGVEEDERFTNLLEGMSPGWRVDNLGMTGWGPDLMLRALETAGLPVRPDLVLLCLYTHDFRRVHPLYAGVGFPVPRYELRDGALVTIPYPAPGLSQKLRVLWAMSPSRGSWNRPAWDLHDAILARFRALAEEHGFELKVVFLPGRADTDADRERRHWLGEWCAAHAVGYMDLTEPILSRPREELFIHGGNPHWNPGGHRLVAELLLPLVPGP